MIERNLSDPCIKAQALVQTAHGSSMLATTCCGCHQSIGHHARLLAGSPLPWVLGLEEYGVAGSILDTCSASMFVAINVRRMIDSLLLLYFLLSLFHRGGRMRRFIYALSCHIETARTESLQPHTAYALCGRLLAGNAEGHSRAIRSGGEDERAFLLRKRVFSTG